MRQKHFMVFAVSCVLAAVAIAQTSAPGAAPPARLHGAEKQASVAAATGKSSAASTNTSNVGMDQPVITLKDGCQPIGSLQPAANCVSSITRAEFEKLTTVIQPDMPEEAKRSFAMNYGRLLLFADVARALHLESDPNTQLLLQLMTQRVLADSVTRHYADEYAHPSEQQIQAYYSQNSGKYREVVLQRLIIPRNPGINDKPKPYETEESAAAEKLRQRWAAGEDPIKLQQAAYEAIGVTGTGTPEVTLGARRPGSLPVNQESVFQLKAGEVSQLYSDQAAFYVYKVASVREIPLSEVQEQISKTLAQQQLQNKLEEIGKSATPVLNDEYFGPAPAAGAPSMQQRPAPGVPPAPNSSPK